MKTTLNISDKVMMELKKEAAETGKTMSELVECALRELLSKKDHVSELPDLPTFHGGVPRVNISNRESLYDHMEGI